MPSSQQAAFCCALTCGNCLTTGQAVRHPAEWELWSDGAQGNGSPPKAFRPQLSLCWVPKSLPCAQACSSSQLTGMLCIDVVTQPNCL